MVGLFLGAVLITGCSPDVEENDNERTIRNNRKFKIEQRYDEIKANSTEDKINAFNAKEMMTQRCYGGIFLSDMAESLLMLIDDVTLLTEVTAKNGMLFYQYTITSDNILKVIVGSKYA